jgi:predicted nucleic acid-binding protein
MRQVLPDVNVLLALMDPLHTHHDAAHRWFLKNGPIRLRLCSHTVNGVLRVASQPKYPNSLGNTAAVRDALLIFVEKTGAAFCKSEFSILDDLLMRLPNLLSPASVADFYLLGLAVSNDYKFASFDRRISAHAIAGGSDALELLSVLED